MTDPRNLLKCSSTEADWSSRPTIADNRRRQDAVRSGSSSVGRAAGFRVRTMSDSLGLDSAETLPVVTAVFPYSPEKADELALRPGDKVQLISRDSQYSGTEGWWVGQLDDVLGVFPANYVNQSSSTTSRAVQSPPRPLQATQVTSANNGVFNDTYSVASLARPGGYVGGRSFFDATLDGDTGDPPNPPSLSLLPPVPPHQHQKGARDTSRVPIIDCSEIEKGEHLGAGAFGTVYCGRWRNRDVALKVFIVSENQVHQEAFYLYGLEHVNIIQMLGIVTLPCGTALVMERAMGGALNRIIEQQPVVGPAPLLEIALQVAEGMLYLHDTVQLCHRDLKSSNILIRESLPEEVTDEALFHSTAVITDFGMAKGLSAIMSRQSKFGTVAYAAPEVCRQQGGFSSKSDVWSFGVVLWELMTFDLPFRGLEPPHLLYKITHCNQTLLIPDRCPPILVDLLADCWILNPEERPSFFEVRDRLLKAKECPFVLTSATEFHDLQSDWREQIERQTLLDRQRNPDLSSNGDMDEYLAELKAMVQAEVEMEYKEKMSKYKAYYEHLMETQTYMLYALNEALHYKPGPPPKPPQRKNPFRGKFGLRTKTSSSAGASSGGSNGCSIDGETPQKGQVVIGPPSNLRHLIHVAHNDMGDGGINIISNLDQQKVNTWGPSMSKTHVRQSVTGLASSGDNPLFKSAPNLAQKLTAQMSLQDGVETNCAKCPPPSTLLPDSPRYRNHSGSDPRPTPPPTPGSSAGGSLSWRSKRSRSNNRKLQTGGSVNSDTSGPSLPPHSPLSGPLWSPSARERTGSEEKKGKSSKGRMLEKALRHVMPLCMSVALGGTAGGGESQESVQQPLSSGRRLFHQGSTEAKTEPSSPAYLHRQYAHHPPPVPAHHQDHQHTSTTTTPQSPVPRGRDAYIRALQDGYLKPTCYDTIWSEEEQKHRVTSPLPPGSPIRVKFGMSHTESPQHSTSDSPQLPHHPHHRKLSGQSSPSVIRLHPAPAERPSRLPLHKPRPLASPLSPSLASQSHSGSTSTLLDTDCSEDPTQPLPAAESNISKTLRHKQSHEDFIAHLITPVGPNYSPTNGVSSRICVSTNQEGLRSVSNPIYSPVSTNTTPIASTSHNAGTPSSQTRYIFSSYL